jgi:hypothetical protein
MINNELLTFIKERLAQGTAKEQITDMLVTHGGWEQKDVEEAFDTMDIAGSSMATAMSSLSKKSDSDNAAKVSALQEQKPVSTAGSGAVQDKKENLVSSPGIGVIAVTSPFEPIKIQKEEPEIKKADLSPLHSEPIGSGGTVGNISSIPAEMLPSSNVKKDELPRTETTVQASPTSPIFSSGSVAIEQPKISSPISGSPGFSAMARQQEPKTLEPTIASSSLPARTGIFQPKREGTSSTPASPVLADMKLGGTHPSGGLSAGPLPENSGSLSGLRSRFASGAPVSQAATPSSFQKPISSPISRIVPPGKMESDGSVAALASKTAGLNFQKSELSPHLQSGMIPSSSAIKSDFPPIITPKPIEPPNSKNIPAFAPGQKLNTTIVSNIQHMPPLPRIAPPVYGRKLFGTIVFLTGCIIGATGMHAYFNGYFDPAIQWVQSEIPGSSDIK